MSVTDSFSASYAEAREKFLQAADIRGAAIETHRHPASGPDGGVLSVDTASIGNKAARKAVILISGTHGVEGYAGSAAQIDWLRRGPPVPDDVHLVLIHAVNPYGFAWDRRVTHENVDLNRNWIDFAAPLPFNAGYEALHDVLCPPAWDPQTQAVTFQQIQAFGASNGLAPLQDAVSAGQYLHADGLFYGGTKPSWSRITLETILPVLVGPAAVVVLLDVHSGLGVRGDGELISLLGERNPGFARARRFFGGAVGNNVSALVTGEFLAAAPALLPNAEVTALALEFGTVDMFQVLNALRADNWLHAHGDPSGPGAATAKTAIKAAFYDVSEDWKAMVLGQTYLAMRQAFAGLRP